MTRYWTILGCLVWLMPLMAQESVIISGVRVDESIVSVEEMYIRANQKRILEKYDDALELYQAILEKNEVNASVHHDMARCYQATGETEKAIASGKKAVLYEPENKWFSKTLADIFASGEYYEDAAKTLEELVKIAPSEKIYHQLADYYASAEIIEKAIATYDNADRIYGWDAYRSDSKVDLWLKLGNEKQAIKEISKWTERYPTSVQEWMKLAQFFEFLGDGRKARKTYEKVLELDPDNADGLFKVNELGKKTSRTSDLSGLINDARIDIDDKIKSLIPILDKKDQQVEVEEMCLSLIQQYPENAKTYALYGDALWLWGKVEDAIPQYEQSLKITKSVYQVWDQLMMALSITGAFEHLSELSTEAQDYYPNQAGPYYYKALSLSALGQFDEAMIINEEARFISELAGGYMNEQSRILHAQILDAQDQTTDAIDYINGLIEDNPRPSYYELLGDLQLKNGDKAAAQNSWNRCIELGGDKKRIELKIQSI